MKRASLTIVVLLGAGASAERATPPKNAAAWCDANPGEAFTISKDKLWTPTGQRKDPAPPQYSVAWRGHLDSDRRLDVILDQGDCGTSECLHAAYVRCADDTYSTVMQPEYASRVRVRGKKRGWGVIELEHVGEPEGNRAPPHSWSRRTIGDNAYNP